MTRVTTAWTWLRARLELSERGATAVEYGMIVALIAAVIVGVVATLGTDIQGAFQDVVDAIEGN
jgi:pilus assembly protein Flp/PilA